MNCTKLTFSVNKLIIFQNGLLSQSSFCYILQNICIIYNKFSLKKKAVIHYLLINKHWKKIQIHVIFITYHMHEQLIPPLHIYKRIP